MGLLEKISRNDFLQRLEKKQSPVSQKKCDPKKPHAIFQQPSGKNNRPPVNWQPCEKCGFINLWLDAYGMIRCLDCDPPINPRMIRRRSLELGEMIEGLNFIFDNGKNISVVAEKPQSENSGFQENALATFNTADGPVLLGLMDTDCQCGANVFKALAANQGSECLCNGCGRRVGNILKIGQEDLI